MKKNQVYGLGDVEVKDHVYDSSTVTKTSTGHSGGIKMKKNLVYGLGRPQEEKDTKKKLPKQSNSKSKKKKQGAASLNDDGHVDEKVSTKDSKSTTNSKLKPTAGNMKYENSAIKDEDRGNEGGYDYVDEKPKRKVDQKHGQGKNPKNGAQSSKGKNTSQKNMKASLALYYND